MDAFMVVTIGVTKMRSRIDPKTFVNFSTRLDLPTHERRNRLEKAYRESAPQLMARLFREFENSLLKQLDDTDRNAYLAGDFDCRPLERAE
jgi:hypothetical protein